MLDQSQLAHFRERQAASLMSTCHRLVYSSTADTYNEKKPTWTESMTDIPCGIDQRPGSERQADKNTVVSYDAIIRLPLTAVFDVKDKIKVTELYGEAITPIEYSIVSPEQRGPSGIRFLLKKVTL